MHESPGCWVAAPKSGERLIRTGCERAGAGAHGEPSAFGWLLGGIARVRATLLGAMQSLEVAGSGGQEGANEVDLTTAEPHLTSPHRSPQLSKRFASTNPVKNH